MVKRKLLLALVFVSLLLAGCSAEAQVGEQETRSQGEGIQIEGPECSSLTNPDEGCENILETEPVQITLKVTNTGGHSVTVPFENPIESPDNREEQAFNAISGNALRTRCPSLFSMVESSLEVERINDKGVSNQYNKRRGSVNANIDGKFFTSDNKVRLGKGEELRFNWKLRRTGKEVPSSGYSCGLSFSLDTVQRVSAQEMVRLRRSSDVDKKPLDQPTSSAAPLVLNIDTRERWIQYEGDFNVDLFVENQESGSPVGAITLEDFSASPTNLISCSSSGENSPNVLRYEKNADRQPRTKYVCSPNGNLRAESQQLIFSAQALFKYRYFMDDITVEVNPIET